MNHEGGLEITIFIENHKNKTTKSKKVVLTKDYSREIIYLCRQQES